MWEFALPPERIAQEGCEPRDAARLMVVGEQLLHRHVRDLPELLRPGDLLVLNESKVIPARLRAHKSSGGQVEVLLIAERAPGLWSAWLRPAKRAGPKLELGPLEIWVEGSEADGTRILRFNRDPKPLLGELGEIPFPPYIQEGGVSGERYQTVYAKVPGSVAAPTAGLHFTEALLERLQVRGIELAKICLHVGPGTFAPIKGDPNQHRMHREAYEVPEAAAEAIGAARREGRRVIAVGTTTVRTLESAWDGEQVVPGAGSTELMIRPPYRFAVIDGLITNFHLPRSTLLLLVSALGGEQRMQAAYQAAITEGYRFYSLGDAMLLFPEPQ
jgi:S-adenosylmethionine:tRNA ribosyltransferase-isomerase